MGEKEGDEIKGMERLKKKFEELKEVRIDEEEEEVREKDAWEKWLHRDPKERGSEDKVCK